MARSKVEKPARKSAPDNIAAAPARRATRAGTKPSADRPGKREPN